MKVTTFGLGAFSMLLASTDGLNIAEPRADPRVFGYNIDRRDTSPFASQIANDYSGFYYTVNITVGTPPQQVTVAIDTGSSNLILNSPDSEFCQSGSCSAYGTYDAGSSTSSKWVDDIMQTTYEVTSMNGSWVLDDVHFEGKTLSQLSIGTANASSNSIQNLWGFGYSAGVVPGIPSNDTTLQSIANAGLTNSASMSIYLNQTGSATGSLLFGGIDTSLYTGALQTLPIVPSDGVYDRLAVNLSSVSVVAGQSSDTMTTGLPARMLLDTGNFDIKLPPQIAASIQSGFNITEQKLIGGFNFSLCACALADEPAVLEFGFGSVNITVPMKSLVVSPPASILEGFGVAPDAVPEGVCLFLINSYPEEEIEQELLYILGGAFLSNAYVIFDQDAQEVALAQANFNPGPSNIQEIASGHSGLTNIASSTTATPTATPTGSKKSDAMKSWQMSALWTFISATILGTLLSL